MFKKLSLKHKLAVSAGLAIIIGGFLVEALSFRASLSRLDTEVAQRLESTTASYNQYVSDWVASKERAMTSLTREADPDNMVTHLKQVRDSGGFDNVFLAYPDGSQDNANGVVLPPGNDDPRKWGWYTNAKASPSNVFMDNPTVAAATGANVVSLGKALQFNGQTLVLGADVEIGDIIEGLEKVILPGSGYMFIANQDGNVFTHANTDLLNQSISELGLSFNTIKSAMNSGGSVTAEVGGAESVVYAKAIKDTDLITVTVINYDSLVAPLFDAVWGQIAVTIAVVIACTLLFNLLVNILFRPLTNVSNALEQIAHGSGDLTQRIEVESDDEVGQLAKNFNTFVGSMHQLISHIREQAQQLTSQSDSSTERARRNVDDINQQQQEVTMVATAVTELASATQEIASHAEHTASTAQASTESTDNGRAVVENTKTSITRLSDELKQASTIVAELDKHSQEISTVLSTIQGIAEQTNLLALNAAIEAARAGEQGRGFAVVADEVRILSQRTHASTEEIKSTIETLQTTTASAVSTMESSSSLAGDSVADVDKATAALSEIDAAVNQISDMATQIATAAEEQTHVTSEITQNITSIKDVSEHLVHSANDTSQEADNLRHQATKLNDKVSTYKL
ncbi:MULTISPECIES: methyl-accepting chemotaxis protein [unclassified Salinivibrio]|uniref:methyl-accepting chemotaxis protein n=1 Tax=unclassified Salinivibrio TaxID=2636825 RepID=UPI0009845373|nr:MULTISPECIES: methyl-accepting chemotaxis protein [unclassified Salinivibrio]OOE91769.1 chemotaxis protein [Salinivibrio sp. AR647]OOE93924.1 chemotaxis protein [Salinivibrio sp. AR640]OOF05717.1 chemotaxis protein [Salinivibrio sp. MA440]